MEGQNNPGYPPGAPYPQPGAPYAQPGPYPPPGDPYAQQAGQYPPAGYPQPGQYPPPQQPAGYGVPQPGMPPPGYGQPQMQQPVQPGYGYPQPGMPPAGYGQPQVQQPSQQGNWMQAPTNVNCPPGLEYLSMVDQLLVKQKVELLEAFTGFETANKYTILNALGQKVYFAAEDTDCCTRNCCGPMRPFDMQIMDNSSNEVVHLNRPLACASCCFPCCLQSIEVSSPPGTVVGSVHQEWSILRPNYSIRNSSGDTVLRIEGPICTWSMCGDVEFKVLSADGDVQVGKISKQWSGLAKETFTDADNFGITFPMDLDVKMKATLLGAVFLIEMMYFEKSKDD